MRDHSCMATANVTKLVTSNDEKHLQRMCNYNTLGSEWLSYLFLSAGYVGKLIVTEALQWVLLKLFNVTSKANKFTEILTVHNYFKNIWNYYDIYFEIFL